MASHRSALILAAALVGLAGSSAHAQKSYGPGVSDTEIKLGQTMPYSGPISGLSAVGKVEVAYFRMVNERGGVNAA
jgi:branched-chain amino acid transport system substrate-binding protein